MIEGKKMIDAAGNEIIVTKDDFKLVQVDKKIHDRKFETKPTTYAHDALKRFRKNKSSVVGAVIIGFLLLMAIFYPLFSPFGKNIDEPHPKECFLLPKLREPKKGSKKTTSNGTKLITVDYDLETGKPIRDTKGETKIPYDDNEIVWMNPRLAPINITIGKAEGASGGTYVIFAPFEKKGYIYIYEDIDYDTEGGYFLDFQPENLDLNGQEKFKDLEILQEVKNEETGETETKYLPAPLQKAEYRIYIQYGELYKSGKYKNYEDVKEFILLDWNSNYDKREKPIDISGKIKEAGLKKLEHGRITIELKKADNVLSYLPLSVFRIYNKDYNPETDKWDEGKDESKNFYETISLGNDAVKKTQVRVRNEDPVPPLGYWRGNADKYVYKAEHKVCDIVFDPYEDIYGDNITMDVDIEKLKEYREKGWCDFNDEDVKTTFKVLDAEKCPVKEIRDTTTVTQYVFTVVTKDKKKILILQEEDETIIDETNIEKYKNKLEKYKKEGWCDFDNTVAIKTFEVLDAEKCPVKIGEAPVKKTYDIDMLNMYKNNGWCEFEDVDFEKEPDEIEKQIKKIKDDFKVKEGMEDKCPITAIEDAEVKKTPTFETLTTMWKYYGYKRMPRYLLGTDNQGRDLITVCFKGLRTSLLLSICVSAICLSFGLCWGAVSGYFGGNVDLFMERFCEILSGVPWIVVMTLAILLMGNNIITFGLALCLTGWMGIAARTRTQFYRFKGREYILASRTLGSSDKRLIFRHILPNSMGTIVTGSILSIPSVIFSEATLAYLNLGLEGSQSFGNILAENQQYLNSYPMLIVFPAIIISLIMISFNLFGNGLRDALNPSLKGSE